MASAPKKPTLAPAPVAAKTNAPAAPAAPVPLAPAPEPAVELVSESAPAVEPAPTPEQGAETVQAALLEPTKVVEQVAEQMQAAMLEPAKMVEAMSEPMREIGDQLREAAEKSLGDTRVAFDRMRAAAEDTTLAFEASVKTAASGVQAFNIKLVEAMRFNAEANFDLLKALVTARTMSEAITLNAEHVRKSFDALSAQSKDLGQTAQKVAEEVMSPLRESVNKALAQAA